MNFQEVSGGPGRPEAVLRDQLHVQHEEGENNNKVLAIWGARKDDSRVVLHNRAIQYPGDGNDYQAQPEDRHIGADTSSSTSTITMPAIEDSDGNEILEDGHRLTVMDAGGNAGTNNITVETPGDETIDSSSISTNNGKLDFMWDKANTNWVDVS